jgi:hypothetical protein
MQIERHVEVTHSWGLTPLGYLIVFLGVISIAAAVLLGMMLWRGRKK